jgi:hypothetical protein
MSRGAKVLMLILLGVLVAGAVYLRVLTRRMWHERV